MRNRILGLVCFALLSAFPVAADELDSALHLYNAGHYSEAIGLLTPLAESGTLDAQLVLSNVYNFGQGVPVDQAEAYRWLALAAGQDSPGALYNLGVMTMNGDGTQSDPQEGMRLINRAAELGNAEAHFRLGVLSMQMVAETGDLDTGLGHLALAGQLGHRGASAFLGVLLQEIPEVEDHLVKSALNLQVAIARGCDDLDKTMARAVARLSPEERALYERSLPVSLAMGKVDTVEIAQEAGPCLPG
jgi:TPR repeat protein